MEPTDLPLDADLSCEILLERRWLPVPGGSLRRLTYTNVPHQVEPVSPGYDWGNHSPGAYDLAVNVLDAVLARMGHGGPRTGTPGRTAFLAAVLLQGRFVADLVSSVPDDGAMIPVREVEIWLERRLAELSPGLLAPRYVIETPPLCGTWSAADAEAILGTPLRECETGLAGPDGRHLAAHAVPHPLDATDWELPL